MCKRLLHLMWIPLILGLGGAARAGVFTDTFETPRDFLTAGVTDSGWDGFVGKGANETVNKLDASTTRPGQLYIESAGGWWAPTWTPLGPFLYKMVQGDFVASVKVTDYAGTAAAWAGNNSCGLMARAAPGTVGTGENWVSLDYFPIWSCGNMVREATNGTRAERGHNGKQWNLDPWLQIERKGNTFYFRTSVDGVTWTPHSSVPSRVRNDLVNVPLQVGLEQCTFTADTGYAAFDNFTVSGPRVVPANEAYNPFPADKTTEIILQKIVLTWTPNAKAVKHDVYFGTSPADVTNATRATPLGVALSVAQDANSCDAPTLARGVTYYWRVDEVRADATIAPGEVWSFTMEPVSYAIAGVTATASSAVTDKGMGPEKAVNGAGLVGDKHSNVATDMWLSVKNAAQPTWIQFAFDKAYKLDKVLVWNSNQTMELDFGFGVKDALVEYSTDGAAWTSLGQVQVPQAAGDPNYLPYTVNLNGAVAKYVKLTVQNNWGGLTQSGLSEVRFYYLPVWPREPQPASAATGLNPQVTLSWRAGREAASHQVYLDTDKQAVQNGTAPVVSVSASAYNVAVNLAQTYYWKVVEVNNVMTPPSWEGNVWSFATVSTLVVDDFESYTDQAGKAVFETWIDGYGNEAKNGAFVGLKDPVNGTFCSGVRHGGTRSMPLTYNNAGGITSEAVRTFTAPQDWSQYGITTLSLWFYGDLGNTPAPLYVKINNTKILFNNGAASTAFPVWKPWNINLTSLGATLKSVKTLTIGIGDGKTAGTGTILVDDIVLYPSTGAPAVVTPVDPGTSALVALYAMEGDVKDTSGKGNDGTISGNPAYGNGPTGYGKALTFDGLDDYVVLPIGSTLSTMSSITIATWINVTGTAGYQRVFDFGTGGATPGATPTKYMYLTPSRSATTGGRFAITINGSGSESRLSVTATLGPGWHHMAVTIDGTIKADALYVDGVAVATGTTAVLPKDLGVTTQNWIGRSEYTGDPFYTGMVDDFRIYNVALTAGQVRYIAGER
jgi:hypothetical protein